MGAYGLKRGAVPAMRVFTVCAVSFALAYALKDPSYPLVQAMLRRVSRPWVEAITYLALQIGFFIGLLAPMLTYCRETVPLHKAVDRIGGIAFGLAGGVLIAGILLICVMTCPGGRSVASGGWEWYYSPHKMVLASYNYLARLMPGARPFDFRQAVVNLETGVIDMPLGETGLWVSSLPAGLRVYVGTRPAGEDPLMWKRELELLIQRPAAPITFHKDSRRRRVEGYLGTTPLFAPMDTGIISLAVVIPLKDVGAADSMPFYWDGETSWWAQEAFGEQVLVKVYHLERAENQALLTHIAAFVPKGEDGAAKFEREWLPSRPSFTKFFDAKDAEKLFPSTEAADRYVRWLQRGGKAVFEAADKGEVVSLEVAPSRTLKERRKPVSFEAPRVK